MAKSYIYIEESDIIRIVKRIINENNKKRFLFETFGKILTESNDLESDDIIQVIDDAGGDPNSEETAKEFLSQLIDSDFKPDQINISDVVDKDVIDNNNDNNNDNNEELNESVGGAHDLTSILTHAIHQMEDTETGVQITEKLNKILGQNFGKITKKLIIKGLHGLEKILNIVPDLVSKGIYKIIRSFGGDIQSSKLASNLGDIIWLIILGIIALHSFPGVLGIAAGGIGILKIGTILLKLWNMGRTIWRFVKSFFTTTKEIKNKDNYDAPEFFQGIEPIWMEKTRGIGARQIPYDWVNKLDTYIYSLDDEERNSYIRTLKRLEHQIKSGKGIGGHIQLIIDKSGSNKDLVDIFTKIGGYLQPRD